MMDAHYRCPACLRADLAYSYDAPEYRTGNQFKLYECPLCGLGVTKPDITSEALGAYYADQYYGSRKGAMGGLINYLWMRKVMRAWARPPGRLLDVGCGNGSFLKAAAALGWDVYGTERAQGAHLSPDIAARICRDELPNCPFTEASFDVITSWHSFEHLQDPERYLKRIAELLREDGMLVIEVPNYRSWQARLFTADWLHLDVPRHLFHFSPESLRAMLERNGFAVQRISYGNAIYDMFGLLQSFLNAVTSEKNIVFDLVNGKARHRTISLFDWVLTILFFIPAGVLAGILWLGERVSRSTGTITLFATLKKQGTEGVL